MNTDFLASVALGALALCGLVALVGRSLLQRWRTGSTGWRGLHGKPGSPAWWGGVLIAASIGRAIVAIGICLLLYFAARQSVGPLLIGALVGLVAVLIGETTVAAKQFKQATA